MKTHPKAYRIYAITQLIAGGAQSVLWIAWRLASFELNNIVSFGLRNLGSFAMSNLPSGELTHPGFLEYCEGIDQSIASKVSYVSIVGLKLASE